MPSDPEVSRDSLEVNEFDDDDIDEAVEKAVEELQSEPNYRATYRKKRLTIVPFFWTMVVTGPASGWFREREKAGTVIADLTRHESEQGDELVISFHSAGRNREPAELAIAEWAASVGYRRLWLPDGLLELEATVSEKDRASVRCTTCGQTWSERGTKFWSMVFEQRAFPTFCPLCGGDLPQWRVEEGVIRCAAQSASRTRQSNEALTRR